MKLFQSIASLLLVFTLCACAGNYSYTPKAAGEVPAAIQGTIITQEKPNIMGNMATSRVGELEITSINGAETDTSFWDVTTGSIKKSYNFSPGPVKIIYIIKTLRTSAGHDTVEFTALPGEHYYFEAKGVPISSMWQTTYSWIVELKDSAGNVLMHKQYGLAQKGARPLD